MSLPRVAVVFLLPLLLTAGLSGCGSGAKKPTQADVAAFVGQSEPAYFRLGGVVIEFDPPASEDKAAAGAWRVRVTYRLRTERDLYAPESDAISLRTAFDRAVGAFEQYRVARIAAVEKLGLQSGLMHQGDAAPEPAVPVVVTTHAGQEVTDHVTLLAEPDGTNWKFRQVGTKGLSIEEIGLPLELLKRINHGAVFVIAGSSEDRTDRLREQRFLDALTAAEK